jgi:hypothetical protein
MNSHWLEQAFQSRRQSEGLAQGKSEDECVRDRASSGCFAGLMGRLRSANRASAALACRFKSVTTPMAIGIAVLSCACGGSPSGPSSSTVPDTLTWEIREFTGSAVDNGTVICRSPATTCTAKVFRSGAGWSYAPIAYVSQTVKGRTIRGTMTINVESVPIFSVDPPWITQLSNTPVSFGLSASFSSPGTYQWQIRLEESGGGLLSTQQLFADVSIVAR